MISQQFSALVDQVLENHGVAFCSSLGSILIAAGFLGLHWIARCRYYRKHRRRAARSYFVAWLTRTIEGNLGVLCLLSAMFGFLCLFVALMDLIDG